MRKIIILLTAWMLLSTTAASAAEYPSHVSYSMENGIFEVRKVYCSDECVIVVPGMQWKVNILR